MRNVSLTLIAVLMAGVLLTACGKKCELNSVDPACQTSTTSPYSNQYGGGYYDPYAQQGGYYDPYAQQQGGGYYDPYAQQGGYQQPYSGGY